MATGGFEPPTNALLQHWSTFTTYYNYWIISTHLWVYDCSGIKEGAAKSLLLENFNLKS